MDPFPSQVLDDPQLPVIQVDDTEEWLVEWILDKRHRKLPGRGSRTRHEYYVKWTGYVVPTWEPAVALADTAALDTYLQDRGGG